MQQLIEAVKPHRSRLTTEINFEQSGRQCGFLSVPFSTHESAYGRIQLPLVCLKNGEGPTALLVAGNHGDEYEGQIALIRLIQSLEPASVSGRIIVLSAANLPAVLAGQRCSPLDDGNLNRAFPGDSNGGPTVMIAHYIESVLLPMADYALDLHSGGSSLVYRPCTLVRDNGAPEHVTRTFAAVRAFGGAMAYVTDGRNQGAERTFHAAADRCEVVTITAELGGGSCVDAEGLLLAEAGTRRFLYHIGILNEGPAPTPDPLRFMKVEGAAAYVLAPESGLFEPSVALGAIVQAGDLAGCIHYPDTPWRDSTPVRFRTGGFVVCRRALCATRRGDCLFQVLVDYSASESLAVGERHTRAVARHR
jgi:predicted deacylase